MGKGLSGPRQGGRALESGGALALCLGEGLLVREGGAESRLGQRPLGAETGREGLRYSWCSCFVLGKGPIGKGGRGRFRAWAKASRGRDMEARLQKLVVLLFCAWGRACW